MAYPFHNSSSLELATSCEQRADFLCRFTFDEVSQPSYVSSTAVMTIHEWRKSFIHVNHVPLDILSFIPTHLSSHKDHLQAGFVCLHWRRTFLQCAGLWSKLFLSKGDTHVKAFLEHAKESRLVLLVPWHFSLPTPNKSSALNSYATAGQTARFLCKLILDRFRFCTPS